MKTKVSKWGNSLGLRIPKVLAQEMEVNEGSEVEISLENGRLVVKVVKVETEDLTDLLARVRPDNLHGEIETSGPAGTEIW
jgi:antitoxin MazE